MTDREHERLLTTATDRFERRLAEESSKLRTDMSQLRGDVGQLRVDMVEGDTATRFEISRLRVDMAEQFAASRIHSETQHRELLKWSLVFWISQAAAVAGIVSAFA